MNLGIFLSSGDSFQDMARTGQDVRFKKFYISYFAKHFDKVYIFSYANEKVKDLPKNVVIVPNKNKYHRLIYNFLMPVLNQREINKCDVIRAYHLSGTMPAVVARLLYQKPFTFNFAYDYKQFVLIEKQYLQYLFLTIMKPLANFFASKVIAASKVGFSWSPKINTELITNGIDVSTFKPTRKRQKMRVEPLLLCVGRFEAQKNYHNLIKGLEGLKIKLKIIGKGSFKEEIENLAKQKKVKLEVIEQVKNTDLPSIYNDADIFLLPSLTEGSPKVLLEAMACGVPVVGAKVKGIEEIIDNRKNGLYCGVDPASIKKSIREMIADSKFAAKLGQGARQTIEDNFDLDKLLKKEVNLIKSCV